VLATIGERSLRPRRKFELPMGWRKTDIRREHARRDEFPALVRSATLRFAAPVAQLDRAPDFESGGRRFEPFRAHQPGLLCPARCYRPGASLDGGRACRERDPKTWGANSAQAYNSSGWVRAFSGDWRTAVEHLKRALRLSPLDLGIGLTLEGLVSPTKSPAIMKRP
jgi:hypothetical protein